MVGEGGREREGGRESKREGEGGRARGRERKGGRERERGREGGRQGGREGADTLDMQTQEVTTETISSNISECGVVQNEKMC